MIPSIYCPLHPPHFFSPFINAQTEVKTYSAWTSCGCHGDRANARIMDFSYVDYDGTTVEKCLDRAKDYPYAGVEFGGCVVLFLLSLPMHSFFTHPKHNPSLSHQITFVSEISFVRLSRISIS